MQASNAYRPGPVVAAVGASVVLVWDPAAGPSVSDVWAAVASGEGLPRMLSVLAAHAAWTALPDFALVVAEPDGLRVLVRGRWDVSVGNGNGDDVHPSGEHAATWTESFVPGALRATVTARADADADSSGQELPLTTGVVLARTVTWSPTSGRVCGPPEVAAIPAPSVGPEPAAVPASPVVPESPRVQLSAPPVAEREFASRPLAELTLPPSTFAAPAEPDLPAGTDADTEPEIRNDAASAHAGDEAATGALETADAESSISYDLLYGTTPRLATSVPVAAAPIAPPAGITDRPRPTSPGVEQGPPTPGPAPLDPPESPSDTASPLEPDDGALLRPPPGLRPTPPAPPILPAGSSQAGDTPPTGLITSPWRLRANADEGGAGLPRANSGGLPPEATVRRPAPGSAAQPTHPSSPAGPTGSDGPTRVRAADPPSSIPDGPTVTAVLCPDRHPNPLPARHCRTCRRAIASQESVVAARPPLGVLRLRGVDAPDVVLDRPVVLGRRPRASGLVNGELPQLVTIPPPNDDVSRSHLQVELDGWNVAVSDLGSANGTVLLPPGAAPLTLSPGVPVRLTSGSRLVLSDDIAIDVLLDGEADR